jgi:hypothetical protein
VRRRQVLAGAVGAVLAVPGCLADPPTTPAAPTTSPNILIEFAWLPDRPAYRVTFRRGNRLTPTNTGELLVVGEDVDYDTGRVVWVRSPDLDRDTDAPRGPLAEFPLTPGPDTAVVFPVAERTTVRVIWRSPDGDRSVSVAQWPLERQRRVPTATNTSAVTAPPTRSVDDADPTDRPGGDA